MVRNTLTKLQKSSTEGIFEKDYRYQEYAINQDLGSNHSTIIISSRVAKSYHTMSYKGGAAHHLANTISLVKHCAGSIVCFSVERMRRLDRINGRMKKAKYNEIFEENLLQSAHDVRMGQRFTFKQDNSLKHTTKTTLKWPQDKCLNVFEWCQRTSVERPEDGSSQTFPIQTDCA